MILGTFRVSHTETWGLSHSSELPFQVTIEIADLNFLTLLLHLVCSSQLTEVTVGRVEAEYSKNLEILLLKVLISGSEFQG